MGPTEDELSDDELVSAVLDREATQAQIDAVTADPRLSARLEELRRLQELHRRAALDDVATNQEGSDARIAAALAAASPSPAADGAVDAGTSPVSHVTTVSAGSSASAPGRRRPLWTTVAGAAAAFLLVVGALGLAVRGGTGSDDSSASGAADSLERSESAGDGAGAPADATAMPTTTVMAAPTADADEGTTGASDSSSASPTPPEQYRSYLPGIGGDFATVDELLAAVTPEVRAQWPLVDAALAPCAVDSGTDAAKVRVAGGTVAGSQVIVVVDGDRVAVYDSPTCRRLG